MKKTEKKGDTIILTTITTKTTNGGARSSSTISYDSDMCLAKIVERSVLISQFNVENTPSLELDEAEVAKSLRPI